MDCTNGLGYVVHGDVCERRVLMKSEMCMQRGHTWGDCIVGLTGGSGCDEGWVRPAGDAG